MKLRPLHDRVVVRRVKEEEKTKGGIIIPTRQKKSRRKVKSLQLAKVLSATTEKSSRWTLKRATASCSANGPARKSPLTAKTCSS